MRYSGHATVVLLLVVLLPIGVMASDETAATGAFFSWATKVSSELDARWNTISTKGDFSTGTVSAPSVSQVQSTAVTGEAEGGAGKLRSSIIVSRDFIRKGNNIPFLPLSTRKRNSPSRGTGALRNPSSARLHMAYKRLRPIKSFTTEKRFFGSRKSITRPRLRTNRRISLSRYRSGRNASRPAYRAARPKRFRSIF